MNKRVITILAIIFGLIILLIASFFKTERIPDIKWAKSYRYESKEANGGWLLKEMLSELYGPENVRDLKGAALDSVTMPKQLYVYYGNTYSYPKPRLDSLKAFIDAGNEALFISNRIVFPEEDSILNPYDYTSYVEDSMIIYGVCDSLASDTIQFETVEFSRKLDSLDYNGYYLFNQDNLNYDSIEYVSFLCSNDSLSVLSQFVDLKMYFYAIPESFSNISSKRDDYLDHFNYVFSNFQAERIVLDHPSFHGSFTEHENLSPIQYILQTPSLAWAYYLTILSMLLFIVFGSKRKQKAIPLIEQKANTSLEYVNVLSKLFQDQDQNHKLVKHMQDIFEHRVQKNYYIDVNREDYLEILSRKSKVDLDRLKMMYRLFNKAKEGQQTSDIQLSQLYSHIDYFHKNAQ